MENVAVPTDCIVECNGEQFTASRGRCCWLMHDGAYFALLLHVHLPQLVTLQVLIFNENGGFSRKSPYPKLHHGQVIFHFHQTAVKVRHFEVGVFYT